MAYVDPNFKTKKALRAALTAGEHVLVFQPGLGIVPLTGTIGLEGPHYPEAHKWYATGFLINGKLIKVK